MKPTVICDVCKNPFELSSADIHKEIAFFDQKRVTLTFYTCPFCSDTYPVQVDDDNTQYLMQEYCKLAVQAMTYKGHSKKIQDKMHLLSTNLDSKRKALVDDLEGHTYRSLGFLLKTLNIHNIAQVY